jgi:hypothetical protein
METLPKETLDLIRASRTHLLAKREISSFTESGRSARFKFEDKFYALGCYRGENNVPEFMIHTSDENGTPKKALLSKNIPLIAPKAILRDRCVEKNPTGFNLSLGMDWPIERTQVVEVVTVEYEVLTGKDFGSDNPEAIYIYHPAEQTYMRANSEYFSYFQPINDISLRSELASAHHVMQRMVFAGHELTRELMDVLYISERALNFGHIDLEPVNVTQVVNQVANVLELAGESHERINELRNLAGEPDRSYVMQFGGDESSMPQSFSESMSLHNLDFDKSVSDQIDPSYAELMSLVKEADSGTTEMQNTDNYDYGPSNS